MFKKITSTIAAITMATSILATISTEAKASDEQGDTQLLLAYDYSKTNFALYNVEKEQEEKTYQFQSIKSDTFYQVNTKYLNVRKFADSASAIQDTLVKGWIVRVSDMTDSGWAKTKSGYIYSDYLIALPNDVGEKMYNKQKKKKKPKPTFYSVAKKKSITKTSSSRYNATNNVRTAQTENNYVTNSYNFSPYEIDLFTRIVNAEAGNEPYAGKLAVASVILNRMESSEFPNSLQGVVYQSGQFSPVSDGSINKIPNQDSIAAVNQILNGSGRTYGILYFYAPSLVKSAYMESRPTVMVIGGHVFKR